MPRKGEKMAVWVTIEKRGGAVYFEGGEIFEMDIPYSMGFGSVELRNTKKAGLHVARFSGSGRFTYSLRLTKNSFYRLGPDYGHRVIPPEEEKDPIKRVLREMKEPISKLIRMPEGEVLNISTFSKDIWRACPEGERTNSFTTDGHEETEITGYNSLEDVNQYASPEVWRSGTISGATYAIDVVEQVHLGGVYPHIETIYVWPNCDPVKLKEVLESL
jgi:hypothetical protein